LTVVSYGAVRDVGITRWVTFDSRVLNGKQTEFYVPMWRIGQLESDVRHRQADMTEIKGKIKSRQSALDLWVLVTGVATILSVWGAALALARFLKP
jgi:hypothetical protein